MPQKIPKDILLVLSSVTATPQKAVIDHIIKNGYITTEELKEKYGYNHPPRAARDVRELLYMNLANPYRKSKESNHNQFERSG